MVLGYHANDFNRTSSPFNPPNSYLVSSQSGISNLYNGNISNWTIKSDTAQALVYGAHMGFKYRYDQLNRIKTEDYSEWGGSSWSNPNSYDNNFTYDANGNILSLYRNGAGANQMDNLSYTYISNTNKLSHVDDAVSSIYTDDVDDQSANNYSYDAIGNLAKDVAEGIDTITWDVYGKIKRIEKSNGNVLGFGYDPTGNRTWKSHYMAAQDSTVVTYYVRDAQGNTMSTYERTTQGSNYQYEQKELMM